MKIGILTFYNSNNFGANLQGLSTYLFLKKKGHTPIFINYKSPENYRIWQQLHSDEQFMTHLNFVNGIATNQTEFCHDSASVLEVIKKNKIDAVIIGSDAVLQHHPLLSCLKFDTKTLVRKRHYVPELLFPSPFWGCGFADSVPTAMMSVSSQNSPYSYFSRNDKKKMSAFLANIKYITVRDTWTKNMVKTISNQDVEITPDPVFAFNYNAPELVLTKEEVINKYRLPKDYVLICLDRQSLPISELDTLKALYAKIGISCVALKLPTGIKFKHKFDYEISGLLPSNDWFSIIKHSKGYIGCNMHPIVVSLHNAVPCFSIDNWGRTDFFDRKINDGSSKVLDIMRYFGVEKNHRMLEKGTCKVSSQEIFNEMNNFPIQKVAQTAADFYGIYENMMSSILSNLKG